MTSIPEYTFVVTNLITKKVIEEVELQSCHWEELYNRPGSGRATARIHGKKTTPQNFAPWNNGLYVLKDGDIRYGGVIGAVQPRAGTGVIDIPILSFEDYLRSRLIKSNSNMANATQTGNDITWTSKDQFLIAADAIAHTQQGDGNIGITVAYGSLSGVLRTDTIHTWDYKFAGEYFEDLAARDNGFDWRIRYKYVNDNPQPELYLKYPRMGRKTQFKLYYQSDGSTSNIQSYDVSGGEQPITGTLAVVGAGEGDSMVRTNIIPTTGGVDYDSVVSFKDVSKSSTLSEYGRLILAQNETPVRTFEVVLAQDDTPHYTEFVCGDDMELRIDDGYNQINSECSVISKKVILQPTHDEEVTVTLMEFSFIDSFA